MKFYHAMIRVKNLEESIKFWTEVMDFEVTHQNDYDEGRFTLVFLKSKASEHFTKQFEKNPYDENLKINDLVLELTYNWDQSEDYLIGRNFGHFAFLVEDVYEFCNKLVKQDITINRPPRDGRMAFFKDPNGVSIELLQDGEPLNPQEPWTLMENEGTW